MTAEKNFRILVIDDNPAIHEDFRKILSPDTLTATALEAAGMELFGEPKGVAGKIQYELDSASQGQAGVLLVKQALEAGRPYAMAFVDIRMPPGMDGVEATQKIWAVDPEIQIVLCTAYADYSWEEMFEKIGNGDGLVILKKPFDTVEALQLTHALTEKWRLHRQSRQKMKELEGMVAERTGELLWKTAFLEAQLNSTIDGILVVDGQGRKILQNHRFTDLLKIPRHIAEDKNEEPQLKWVTDLARNPGDFIGKVVYLNAHPDKVSQDEIELKDGTILDRYSAPVLGLDGKYYGRIWTFRDVTGRRRMEWELKEAKIAAVVRESAQRYNFLADTVPLIIWTAQPDGGLDYYNKTWFDYTGLTLDQTKDWGWKAVLHPADLEACIKRWTHSFTTGENYEIEYRFKRAADGTYRWFLGRATARRNEAGEIVQWVGTCTDIEDQKHAEAELRQAHSQLESRVAERTVELAKSNDALQRQQTELRLLGSAVEQSKESIVITDAELNVPGPKIVFVNPAFTQMTGYTAAEAIGKTPRILQGPLTDKNVLRRLRQNLERGGTFAGETTNYRKDGTEFNLEWQVAPLRNAGGKITHFVAIQHDITRRKQLEAKLFQSQKMETVGKLAGGFAHEFNSILTAIMGQSELLAADLPAGSPLITNAVEVTKAAERAAKLTRQLLAYGRKQYLQAEILDLNRVIAGMEGVFNHLMGGGVEIRIVTAGGLQAVTADSGQIEQVIINLAMNARDAMPNGGKFMLETANVFFDQEIVGGYPELKPGGYVMLAITDTGAGMSEAVKARVFEPFFTTKDVGQGTGLGLSTCYGIIKQSGGHIGVYSEPGRGTTFKIYLPQVEAQVVVPLPRLDSPDLPRGTETILLVEDDPAMREMAVTLLRRLGYTVLAAANGIEALSLKQQRATGHVDLLFTDVVMPHMSGKELADRVRALYPHTKILFSSAYTENAIVHQGVLDKGATLLQKPFTPSALAQKLREVLDQPPKDRSC